MTEHTNRRKFLKFIGTTTFVGMAGETTAKDDPQSAQKGDGSQNRGFDHDLKIRNNAQEAHQISVDFEQTNEQSSSPASIPVQLERHVENGGQKKVNLDVPGGEYNLNVRIGGEKLETQKLQVHSGGLPSYESVIVMILPNQRVRVYELEA